jgi:hypothetical protein
VAFRPRFTTGLAFSWFYVKQNLADRLGKLDFILVYIPKRILSTKKACPGIQQMVIMHNCAKITLLE